MFEVLEHITMGCNECKNMLLQKCNSKVQGTTYLLFGLLFLVVGILMFTVGDDELKEKYKYRGKYIGLNIPGHFYVKVIHVRA